MRIWHSSLIPKLCQKHICAMWFEGGIAYNTLTGKTQGWKNHPAVKEFKDNIGALWRRLYLVREEMLKRGYHPKALVEPTLGIAIAYNPLENQKPWQTLDQQIEVLKQKGCKCKI